MDECIEWQVNYGYQKFHKLLIKIQKKHLKLPFSLSSIHDQNTIFIQISHIAKLHTHTSIFGSTQIINPSIQYTVNSITDSYNIQDSELEIKKNYSIQPFSASSSKSCFHLFSLKHQIRQNPPYTHTLSLFMKKIPWWSLLLEEVHNSLVSLTLCSIG